MFTRILVPLDGTAEGTTREESALAAAQRLARREGAQLVLLHVDADATSAQAVTRAEMLDRSAALSRAGTHASIRFTYAPRGATDDGIVHAAREEGADLIVISPRQRPLLRTLLRPGVTAELVRHAPAPVLVWPESLPAAQLDAALDGTTAPIIVPLDGSPEAERALPLAEAFAQAHGRSLLLVTVATLHPILSAEVAGLGASAPVEDLAPKGRLVERLRYLQHVRKEIAARSGLPVQTMGRFGHVADAVADLAASHPGSMVVMTTHGRGRALRLLLGSVATELLRLTPVLLVIVPPQLTTAARAVDTDVGVGAVQTEEPEMEGVLEGARGPLPTF